jgi:hypothetical protein
LAGHTLLGLTEGEVRGGLRVLEKAGVIVREPMERRHAYRPTIEGLRRCPIQFRFAPLFLAMFKAANRWMALKGSKRQATPNSEPKANNSYSSEPKVVFLGEQRRATEITVVTDPASPLELALSKLRRAILTT